MAGATPGSGAPGSGANRPSTTPREAQVIQSVLKDMGIMEYEPAVISQLLDFTYKYTTDILDDARAFSTHAGKKSLDTEDIKLAVQLKLDKSYTNPPPRELLLDVAAHKNGQSLPLIKPYTGPKLPPDRYCLSAMNYQLRTSRKPSLSYSIQHVQGVRTGPRGTLSPGVSLVNRVNVASTGQPRPIKLQPGSRQPVMLNTTPTSGIHPATTQALTLALSSAPVKRKLDASDDYDA